MTSVDVRSFTAEDEEPFASPGTAGPGSAWVAPRKFVSAVVVAGVATVGTLGIVTPADAAAAQAPVIEAHTLPAGAAALPAADPSTDVPELLRRIRKVSRLSWGELASALGVSRRTIHHWLSGAHPAGVHVARLADLEALVEASAESSPEATRARLLRPQASGRSLLEELALSFGDRSRPISTVSVGDLLGPAERPAVGSTVRSKRRSSLRGGSLRKRPRSDE